MATMKTLNGYGFNATELNGKAASDYLLKTDTAADSAKLGGKAPEYYLSPRNLLDNSDFRNPVNQREATSYSGSGYTIDRWFLQDAGDGISISDDGVTFNATNSLIVFLQKIDKEIRKVLIGKTITVSVTDSSGNVGICTCIVPNFGEGVDSEQNSIGDTNLKVNIYTMSNDDTLHIRLLSDSILSPVTIVNIALYEGSYTADTLPPYVPKGYAAELAECQRYFRKGMQAATIGNQYNNSGSLFSLSVPRMRIKPTVTLTEISSQGWGNVAASNYTLEWNGDLGSSFYANYVYSVSDDVGKTVIVFYEMSADL